MNKTNKILRNWTVADILSFLRSVWTLCFLPLWLLPNSFAALAAGSFCLQMGVQGAWGVV